MRPTRGRIGGPRAIAILGAAGALILTAPAAAHAAGFSWTAGSDLVHSRSVFAKFRVR